MTALAHHVALGIALAALGGAAVRAASLAAPAGLERVLGAAALGATAAAAEALLLGLVGLGTSPAALTLAAVATWALVRWRLPAPETRLAYELAAWWGRLSPARRVGAGMVVGAAAAYAAWLLNYPVLQRDGIGYHLTEVGAWIHNGRPGSTQTLMYEIPTTSYPLTNEVLLSWASGISRTFVPVMLWTIATLGLLGASAWAGLRALRVPPLAAGLATAAMCTVPVAIDQLPGPNTDLPATAWLVTAGALCAASARRPALLVPAVLAAGLAVGTKSTTIPLALAALSLAAAVGRRRLRPLALPLGLATAAALGVGGIWYIRNLLEHGSPLWPFYATSWGDPVPPFLRQLEPSLLDRPRATLAGHLDDYLGSLGGAILISACALAAPLVARRRAVLGATAVAAITFLLWAQSPITGIAPVPLDRLALAAVRYLLPAIAAATLAVALAARERGRAGTAATAALGAGLAWNVVRDLRLDFPTMPSVGTLLAGAAVGVIAALLAGVLPPRWLAGGRAAVAVVALAALLAPTASGFVERHAKVGLLDPLFVRWFASRPEFRNGHHPIAVAPLPMSVLAGDYFQHRVSLVPRREQCARIRQRARRGWVVIDAYPFPQLRPHYTAEACLRRERPLYERPGFKVYALGRGRETARAGDSGASRSRPAPLVRR